MTYFSLLTHTTVVQSRRCNARNFDLQVKNNTEKKMSFWGKIHPGRIVQKMLGLLFLAGLVLVM